MGMYDTFRGNCPTCNADFEIQTKIFECDLLNIIIGSKPSILDFTNLIELKQPCSKCNKAIIARFVNGYLLGFGKYSSLCGEKILVEKAFGDLKVVE